ncbi:MAG: hypothetical protein ACI4PT_09055 [Candidatus Avoscillospira sp.]
MIGIVGSSFFHSVGPYGANKKGNLHTTNCPQDSALGGADREGSFGIIIDIIWATMVRTSLFVGLCLLYPGMRRMSRAIEGAILQAGQGFDHPPIDRNLTGGIYAAPTEDI